MKKSILTLVIASIVMLLQAQEVMKVELKDGKSVEYKLDDINRVYFDTVSTSDEDNIKTDYLTMFVGDKGNIEGTVITATSENDFIASVNGNVVTANHVGVTYIIVNEKTIVLIMVFSLYNSFPDPVLKWGEPKDTIKAHHKTGTMDKDDPQLLSYKNCGDASSIRYLFDDDGKLKAAGMQAKSGKSIAFIKYLQERYFIYPEKIGDYYMGFDGYDKEHIKNYIAYYPDTDACIFMPYSSTTDNSSETRKQMARMIEGWNGK